MKDEHMPASAVGGRQRRQARSDGCANVIALFVMILAIAFAARLGWHWAGSFL